MREARGEFRPSKEVSVMAWIEDCFGKVFLVRQAAGKRYWTLPGGKVKPRESLLRALVREVREETGLRVTVGPLIQVLDRPAKGAVALLYAANLKPRQNGHGPTSLEIAKVTLAESLPQGASPSARYFWKRQRG
jgi:ADP-ribose pyrophosphatase YjhB (NUDIX family)